MQKKTFCLIMTLTIVNFAESSPVNVGTLEFDNLDNDYNLRYENEGEDWVDAFSKLFSVPTSASKAAKEKSADGANVKLKTSGFKQKNKESKGVKSKYNSGDLNTFFKVGDVHDHGDYDDADVYARADAAVATAAVTNGKETRTYERGNKSKGFHRVHHKDEYKKDQEFYENDVTKGTINKAAAKALGAKIGAGAGFTKSMFNHNRHKGIYGKQGNLDNKFWDKEFSEFSDKNGYDGSFSN